MAKAVTNLLDAIDDYAKKNYQASFAKLESSNIFYDSKGRPLTTNNLNNHKSDKLFIAVNDDGKASPVYLDEKKLDSESSSYNDRQPLKWYKLIIAAIYAIFKAIKGLINIISSGLQKRSLNKALNKAQATNLSAKNSKIREEKIKLEVDKQKSLDSKDISKEIKDINKNQIERERELSDIKKNLKKINKNEINKENEIKQIKDNLTHIDMSAVEERIKIARIKGLTSQNQYQKMTNKSDNIFDKMDMIDLIINNLGYKEEKKEISAEEKKPSPAFKSNPYRKPIEVEELKNEINPIDRIFNNLSPTKEHKLTK